jgi:hypothetical protein
MINYLKKIYYEKYSRKSYSLSNVDLVIERIFKKKDKGIFIDVGCNHPIKYNNTYLLYKKGWSGINIDLDMESINQFNKLRKKIITLSKPEKKIIKILFIDNNVQFFESKYFEINVIIF